MSTGCTSSIPAAAARCFGKPESTASVKPPVFEYHRARSVPDALDCLSRLDGDVKLLAGGQSLVPMLNFRLARPDHLVDLNGLNELDYVRASDGVIEIGAMTRHHRVATNAQIRAALPLLTEAARSIGHYAIRQRGTLGGSLAHADPAAQLPLLAVALDAALVCRSSAGQRSVPARDFFQSIMTTALEPREILIGARFPKLPPRAGWGFEIFNQRHGDFAIVAVVLLLTLDEAGRVSDVKLAVGGIAATPVRFDEVTAQFTGRVPTDEWPSALAEAVQSACAIEETRIPAVFREELVVALTRRAASAALQRAREASR
jgi:carbon-monoxide dehydrogenase medium subunit